MSKTNNSLDWCFFLLSAAEQEGRNGEKPHHGQYYDSAALE